MIELIDIKMLGTRKARFTERSRKQKQESRWPMLR